MAKRRRARARTSSGVRVIKVPSPSRAAAPIIRVSAPRAPSAKKHHRRRRGGGTGGALTIQRMAAFALGGAVVGFLEKQFPNLPTIPLIGRKGTIAAAAYMLARKGGSLGGIARDVAVASAVLAGNELGATGHVSGAVAPQVTGSMAAQI